MKCNSQNIINESIITSRIKNIIKNIIIIHTSQFLTSLQNGKINILNNKFEKIHLNINKNIKMLKIIIKSDLSENISILNQMKNIIILFQMLTAIKVFS